MPYTNVAELPPNIRKLSARKQRQWMAVFNSAHVQHGEAGAFKMANAAIAEETDETTDLSFIAEDEDIFEREFSQDERDRLAKAGRAMPGGGFPIASTKDLQNAIQAIGRAKDPAAAKAHIQRRARAMGHTDMLPDAWKEDADEPMEQAVLSGVTEVAELVEEQEGGTVEVTIIKAGWSENGRYYSREVLARSASLFEGTHAYIDHPTSAEQRERPNRSVYDLAGIFEGVHQAANGDLKAKLRLLGKRGEELRPLIKEAIGGSINIGVSIRAAGLTRQGLAEGRKGLIVEELKVVHSVDIVTNPAAGGRFERLVASDWLAELIKEIPFEDWHSHHPEWEEKPMAMSEELKEQIAHAVEEATKPIRDELTETRSTLSASQRKELARSKLEASELPRVVLPDLLEQVAGMEDAAQDRFIETQVKMFKKLPFRPVITGGGQGSGTDSTELREQELNKLNLLGGAKMVQPGEDIWAYKERLSRQTA